MKYVTSEAVHKSLTYFKVKIHSIIIKTRPIHPNLQRQYQKLNFMMTIISLKYRSKLKTCKTPFFVPSTDDQRSRFLLSCSVTPLYPLTAYTYHVDLNHHARVHTSVSVGNGNEYDPIDALADASVDCRPTVGRLSTDSRPTVDRQSTDSRPTVDRQSTDSRPTRFPSPVPKLHITRR